MPKSSKYPPFQPRDRGCGMTTLQVARFTNQWLTKRVIWPQGTPGKIQAANCWNPGPSPLKMMLSKFGISFSRGDMLVSGRVHFPKPKWTITTSPNLPSSFAYHHPSPTPHQAPIEFPPQKKLASKVTGVTSKLRGMQIGPRTMPRFHCDHWMISIHTVDGRNPAPVDMVNIPLFRGFYTSR